MGYRNIFLFNSPSAPNILNLKTKTNSNSIKKRWQKLTHCDWDTANLKENDKYVQEWLTKDVFE